MNKEQFQEELQKLGIDLTGRELISFNSYCEFLKEYNKHTNLTSIKDDEGIFLKHFYDSLTIVKMEKIDSQYICDIGTGAGFPGLVLKIVFPNIKIDLLDATSKKCNFLKLVVDTLKLDNVNIINKRAEEYSHECREKYDIVVSRAVAPLKHLLEYSVPLLKVNGLFIALKSNIDSEIINIDNYYKKLELSDEKIIKFNLPYEDSMRTIYRVRKNKVTSNIYPRTYSQIKKKEI